MEWLTNILLNPASPAYLAMIFALVIWIGMKLGKINIGGISLGVTFVLFVGILAGHCYNAWAVAPHAGDPEFAAMMKTQTSIINFVQEFGLILFVYCIGLQVGPSFFVTFKKGGLGMNLLSVGLVLLNVAVMLGLYFLVFYHAGSPDNKQNLAMMTGVMYGAVTNTPGLGAANSVLEELFPGGVSFNISNGYACAYPLGVLGIIGATILLRYLCRVKLEDEAEEIEHETAPNPHTIPHHFYIKVTNKGVYGKTLIELHDFLKCDFICSRAKKDGVMFIPNGKTTLEEGMKLMMVCATADQEAVTSMIGEPLDESWRKEINESSKYVSRKIIVTNPLVNGKTFEELHFSTLYNVNVTRVTRAGMTLFARRGFRLQMGDRLTITGTDENINRVKDVVGDAVKLLNHPNVGMVFFGILVGVLLGQFPIPLPGIDTPVRLGLAGGPLVVAILIGAFGYKFNITAYTTTSANLMLREVGLVLFLAGVGIKAGASFWDTVVNGGLTYVWTGFLITVIPIIICGLIGRLKMKLNYFTLMGLIAGTNTDPPALAFANQTANNDAPAIGYSTVYPLSMFMRIVVAQLVLLMLIPIV